MRAGRATEDGTFHVGTSGPGQFRSLRSTDARIFFAPQSSSRQFERPFSIPETIPQSVRTKTGFCSRVSTTITGFGVRSCVPPRSANDGQGGVSPLAERSSCHLSGEVMSVRRRSHGIEVR